VRLRLGDNILPKASDSGTVPPLAPDECSAAEAIASSLVWSAGSVSEIPVAMNLVCP
jgi:hypothetical protein